MTQQQYDSANAHRIIIKHIAEGGSAPTLPQSLFDLSPQMGLGQVDQACNGCKLNWIKELYNHILNYENGSMES